MAGILITFEGIDFCGKSVQMELLVNKIVNLGKSVVVIREPGGTLIAEKIRDVLLKKEHEEISPLTEFLLYSAARAQVVQEKIFPNLAENKIVICDRFYDSTTAYQGYGREIELSLIHKINQLVTQGISPQITFLLDIEIDELEKRKRKINVRLDRMERETLTFFNKVRQGYLSIAKNNPQRFKIINGNKSISEIENEIWNHFWNYLQGGEHVI